MCVSGHKMHELLHSDDTLSAEMTVIALYSFYDI